MSVCCPLSLVGKVAWNGDIEPELEWLRTSLTKGGTVGAQWTCLSELPREQGAVRFQEAVWTGNFCLGFNAQK